MGGSKNVRRPVGLVAGASLALAGAALVSGSSAVVAQPAPTASAEVVCGDDGGTIQVSIVDDFSTTYDVFIDGEPVDEGVTDSDDGTYDYGPYGDGVVNVRVHWIAEELDILDVDLTVDCVSDETTPTTAAPTTTTVAPTPTTAPPAAGPVVAAPTYTG